ncbi:hypothetical protein ACFX15_033988 [Malus domestica]
MFLFLSFCESIFPPVLVRVSLYPFSPASTLASAGVGRLFPLPPPVFLLFFPSRSVPLSFLLSLLLLFFFLLSPVFFLFPLRPFPIWPCPPTHPQQRSSSFIFQIRHAAAFKPRFAAVFREGALRSGVLIGSGAPHHHHFNVSRRRRFRDLEFWVCFLMGGDPESPPIHSSPSRF